MANSDKDILITPNTGQTSEPTIEFTGADNTPLTLRVLDDGTVSFEGTAGQLFSVSDGLSGTIFSVNDISGIPSIEVLDDGTVKLAEYNGIVTAPTPTAGNNSTQVATTAFVTTAIDNAGGSSGTVTSVAMTVPTGLSVSGSPITTSGTLAISLSSGYVIPTTTALDAKAPLSSPTFTGTVTLPSSTSIGTVSSTEIGYLDGVTSGIQTQLNAKAPLTSPTFTGTVTAAILDLTTAATATTATSYWVETGSDGIVRPKTLANVRTEIVTNAAVNSAAATTVGTVTSGTWAATDVALAHGGTNASLTAVNGGIVYSTASAMAITSAGTAGQVLTSNGSSAPTWETPSAGAAGFDAFLLSGM